MVQVTKTIFIFKISLSQEKYFQVLCSNTRNQPLYRFSLNSLCKNQAWYMKNLGKNGLFGGQFFQKSKREIIAQIIEFFAFWKKSVFSNSFLDQTDFLIFDFVDFYAKWLFPVSTIIRQKAKKSVFWAIWFHELSSKT